MKALTKATVEILEPLAHFDRSDRVHVTLSDDQKKFVVDHYSVTSDGQRSWKRSSDALFERIPERQRIDAGKWLLGATDVTVAVLDAVAPAGQIVWDTDAKLVRDYCLLKIESQEKSTETCARYHDFHETPTQTRVISHPELPLKPHQVVGAHNAVEAAEGYGLFMEQGTGKTPTGAAVVCTEAERVWETEHRPYLCLVVCPNQVRSNWVNEMMRFATCEGVVQVVRGGSIRRVKQLIEAFNEVGPETRFVMFIIGYETLANSQPQLEMIARWDLCIADEAHAFKQRLTNRWTNMKWVRDRSAKRIPMTGTPVTNSVMDLWTMLEFIEEGGSGFTSYEKYRQFYGVFDDSSGHNLMVGTQNMPLLQERICRRSHRVTKAEALPDLPEKMYDVIGCEMSPEQAECYKQVATQLAIEIENELDSSQNKSLTINNVLTKLLRLAQITSGFITWDKVQDPETGDVLRPAETEYFDPCPKHEMLISEVKSYLIDSPKSKVIVWACWRPDIKRISEGLADAGVNHRTYYGDTTELNREQYIREFNGDDSMRVMVINASCGGAGLNLLGYPPGRPELSEMNCDWHCVLSQDWSSVKRMQLEDRSHRDGTRVPVRYTDFCVGQTIDEEIRARVLKKITDAMEVNDVRGILRAILTGVQDND